METCETAGHVFDKGSRPSTGFVSVKPLDVI